MRNLRNIKHSCLEFPAEAAALTATAWDPSDDSLICAFGPSPDDPLLSLKRFSKDAFCPEDALNIASWEAPSPNPDLAFDKILNLHCFADTRTIVLILAGGDIILVREEPEPGQDLIEIVGSVDSGIAAAQWSLDEELLVLATCENTVLFMTRDFESTANVTQSPEDVKVSDHVSVGWGKKETQFEGRGAKALRDPTVPLYVDEGVLPKHEDGRVSITWRGDGQYVAINAVIKEEPQRRIVRFYTREGVLDSVSAPVDYMGGALSWKPTGQLVASIQHVQDRTDVIFFERNGLRHGEFSLRLPEDQRQNIGDDIHLSWNVDSTVLAVVAGPVVQLWTTGNYHWYLKQQIILDEPGKFRPVSAIWHPEKPLRLICDDGRQLRSLDFNFDVACGPVTQPHDTGLVAVIDGQNLKITPLRRANVPPPQAFEEVELPYDAIDVAFSRTGTEMSVLHAAHTSFWTCDYSAKPVQSAKMKAIVEIPQVAGRTPVARQIAVSSENKILSLCSTPNEEGTIIASGHFDSDVASIVPLPERITTIFATANHKQLLCENGTAELFSFDLANEGTAELVPNGIKLPVACPRVEVWHGTEQDVTVGLTATGILHVLSDYKPLKITGCTSFALAPSHLIYTTSQHLLKFVHLHDGELEVPADEPEKDERCRNVERGAKLVTVIPSAYSVVLQMPRGNLETIYPRALVLAGIRASINDKDYKKAFKICRVQRVDHNILHDYAPEQFMQNVDLFVKQVKKTEYIDLVLTLLSEENVAETMYKETLRATTNEPVPGGTTQASSGINAPSKVNSICDAFIAVLEKDRAKHLQSIVTAHVSKEPADLEAGLQLVSELRKQGDQKQLEHAVDHICFLADVNRLYETALGLYDIDVALLVAQQSQKDPKEYLPYLQNLLDQQPLRQRFSIDNDLKRYRKALTSLHAMEEFEELKAYVGKHELHGAAMELYRYDDAKIHELMGLYATFLLSRNRYEDAGIAFDFIKDYSQAYEAYRSASMWRESLASAALVPITDSELTTLAQDLAGGQEESKDFVAAATIYVDYLDDLPYALKLLCKAHKFAEAMRLAVQKKQPELIAKVVDQGLIESSATMTELLADMKTQLNEQVPRIRELRQKKAEDPMAFLGEADDAGGDVPDNLSIAPSEATTSGGTLMTRYTNRSTGTLATNATRKTSKNRRREERKRAKGKKGTVYEEEYLVNSIIRLVERLNSTSEDVSNLLQGLMRRAMRERAVAVETAMAEVVAACKVSIEQVFETPTSDAKTDGGAQMEGEYRPWGGQGVHWEALSAAGKKVEAPVLKAFERSNLLQ